MSETPVSATPAHHTDSFLAHRSLLFTVAYEMLGSAADAEDVVQEVWLRWAGGERGNARRREDYVGPWLPEPLLTSPDVAEDAALADSVSTAMLLVLETLPPTERAVFVLREVFDVPYDEIADAVDKSESAVRQIAHRARSHVAARRPKTSVTTAERDAVIERFRAATETGDLQGLMDLLAPDVVLLSDGGGRVKAALHPIRGRDKVLRFLAAVAPEGLLLQPVWLNGSAAIQFAVGDHCDSVGTMVVEDGAVTQLFLVRNPDKLTAVGEPTPLAR